jgi:methionyl-tRNA formyltransferase
MSVPGGEPGWVLLGCTDATRETLHRLARLGALPTEVVTIKPHTAARNGVTNYVDLAVDCEHFGVPCIQLQKYGMDTPQDVQTFAVLRPAALLVVGWQRLIPLGVLEHIGMAAAFHASPGILPYGRGRAPVNWTILEERRQMALHLFELVEEADAGDIIGIHMLDVNEYDNARSVYYKIAVAQAELIAEYVPLLLSGHCPKMRQRGEVRVLAKRAPEDGRIHWSDSAEAIARLVRAVTHPFPGAFCDRSGKRVSVWGAQPFSRDMFPAAVPGEVCFVPRNGTDEFVVKCGDCSLLITSSHGAEGIAEGELFT